MKSSWRMGTVLLGVVCFALAVSHLLRAPVPGIVLELRGLSETASVEYWGPMDAKLAVVHVRDWHLVPIELAKPDGVDYPTLMKYVEYDCARQRPHAVLHTDAQGAYQHLDPHPTHPKPLQRSPFPHQAFRP